MGLGVANYTFVRRFRGRRAFVIDLDVGLEESFTQNIHPGSSISNPDRDPMRRAIYLRSRGDRKSSVTGINLCAMVVIRYLKGVAVIEHIAQYSKP